MSQIKLENILGENYPTRRKKLSKDQQQSLCRQEYDILDGLPVAMEFPACGLVDNPQRGPEVLIADGRFSFAFSLTDFPTEGGSGRSRPCSQTFLQPIERWHFGRWRILLRRQPLRLSDRLSVQVRRESLRVDHLGHLGQESHQARSGFRP